LNLRLVSILFAGRGGPAPPFGGVQDRTTRLDGE
jgi:hypothetical protein